MTEDLFRVLKYRQTRTLRTEDLSDSYLLPAGLAVGSLLFECDVRAAPVKAEFQPLEPAKLLLTRARFAFGQYSSRNPPAPEPAIFICWSRTSFRLLENRAKTS